MTEDRAKDAAALLREVGGTEVGTSKVFGCYVGGKFFGLYDLEQQLGREATEAEMDTISTYAMSGRRPGGCGIVSWKDYGQFLQEWRRGFAPLERQN